MKLLLLARHPESTKNLNASFSSVAGDEELSQLGRSQADALIRLTLEICERLALPVQQAMIATSPTERASAVITLVEQVRTLPCTVFDQLKPIDSGQTSGLSEAEARLRFPAFMNRLELYRAGLGNSYDLGGYGEDVRFFESRVSSALTSIEESDARLVLVVAHRSSLTAILLSLARRSLGYPSQFYGYVPLELGCVSAILLKDGGKVSWIGVNLPPEDIKARVLAIAAGTVLD